MENGPSSKRRRIVPEQNNTDDGVTHTIAPLYFDTLVDEVVSIIIAYLSFHERKEVWDLAIHCSTCEDEWLTYELLDCSGLFGDVLRRSLTQLSMCITNEWDEDDFDGQSVENGQLCAYAWQRYFVVDCPRLLESCRFLRSLELTFDFYFAADFPSLNLLFASCGDVLEELKVGRYRDVPMKFIFESIANHCHSLRTLSLMEDTNDHRDVPYMTLFRSIGGRLRRLKLTDLDLEPFSSIWQYCTVLEELELELEVFSDEDLPFLAEIRPSLKVITLHRTPGPDKLIALTQLVPDVDIHLSGLNYYPYNELEDVVRICGKQLRTLNCIQGGEGGKLPCDFQKICGSLINLQELEVRTNKGVLNFLEPFFVTPKPNLRQLFIRVNVDAGIFDFLATKISTLERMEVVVTVSDKPLNGMELTNFLSTNKLLKRLYIRNQKTCNSSVLSSRASIIRKTALLTRSLKHYNALRKFRFEMADFSVDPLELHKVIVDACVGFRGREIDIEIDEVHYVRKGIACHSTVPGYC